MTLVKQLATIDAPGIFRLVFGATLLPRANEVGVDLRVLGIAFGTAALTSVMFGVLPALHLSRTTHLDAMGARGSAGPRRDAAPGGAGRRTTRDGDDAAGRRRVC